MSRRREAQEILRHVGTLPDDAIDVTEAALALATLQHPAADLDGCRRHLALLADEVAELADADPDPDDLGACVSALHRVIIVRHGYQGDTQTFDDMQNADLIRVIERRKGMPVALGIIYLHVARAQGWTMVGLNFPGHFLVRLDGGGARAILDPFNAGQACSASDLRALLKTTAGAAAELEASHYAAVGNRDILLRLQNNIKLRYLRTHQVDKALEMVEGMLLFAPQEATLWRELGLLHAHLDHLPPAIAALERFLRLGAEAKVRRQAELLLQQLKNRLT